MIRRIQRRNHLWPDLHLPAVIHAQETAPSPGDVDSEFVNMQELLNGLRQSEKNILSDAAAIARQASVSVETKLLEIDHFRSKVAEFIAREAEDWPADLIVIGTHGRRGLNRLLLGSVADGVIRTSTRPVLLMRGV